MNSGINFGRMLRPYMIASTILMLIALTMNHIVLPISNKKMGEFEETYYRERMRIDNYYAELPGHILLNFASYVSDENVISDFVLEQTNTKNELKYFIKAKSAVNIPGTKKWKLSNYYERIIEDSIETIHNGFEKDTIFTFKIEDVAQRENIAETMSYFELKNFIEIEKKKGSPNIPLYEIVLYERTSLPFATYILTIIGVAVSSRKKRGGIGINIAIGLGIIFVYIFAMKVTTVAAMNVGFPTYLAVWMPNLIFGVVAYVLYKLMPK